MSNLQRHPAGTMVVPPSYEAVIYGFDYALLSARKVILFRAGERAAERTYNAAHAVAGKSFAGLVQFVTSDVTAAGESK